MKSIWDLNLREFRDKIANYEPTPGGGSVSAVVATEGLALILMALEVNLRRKEPHPESAGLFRRAKNILEPLTRCADEDVVVFNKYIQALKMPRNDPEEEQARSKAIAVAASAALEAPLRASELYLEGLIIAKEAGLAVHAGIVSDVGAGAALLYAAITATLYNVDVNLRGIEEPARRAEALTTRREFQRKADELLYVIRKETEAKLYS